MDIHTHQRRVEVIGIPQPRATILFTDVKSSSKLWKRHGSEMEKALDEHFRRVQQFATSHRGLVVKTIGDAFMVAFEDASVEKEDGDKRGGAGPTRHGTRDVLRRLERAVDMAIDVQNDLRVRPIRLGDDGKDTIQIRIGIADGLVSIKHHNLQGCDLRDFFGPTANIASRMESKVSPVGGFAVGVSGPPSDDGGGDDDDDENSRSAEEKRTKQKQNLLAIEGIERTMEQTMKLVNRKCKDVTVHEYAHVCRRPLWNHLLTPSSTSGSSRRSNRLLAETQCYDPSVLQGVGNVTAFICPNVAQPSSSGTGTSTAAAAAGTGGTQRPP